MVKTLNEILTPKQAAEELGITPERVQALCRNGKLGKRLGREYMITREELEEFKLKPRKPGRPPGSRNKPKALAV